MRIARHTVPALVHHVIIRFVNEEWFIRSDTERARYLRLLERALERSDWQCLAYCLMSNHIHLALLAGEIAAERWMRRVHPPWVGWMNEQRGRIGPMFAGRPQMWGVRPEHVGRLIAYIHNNPVRARVVERACDSPWSSHGAYLGTDRRPWISVEQGLRYAGVAAGDLDAFVHAEVSPRVESPPLEGVHRAARTRGAIELGTPVVGERVEVPLLARRYAYLRPEPRRVIEIVGAVLGRDPLSLCSRARAPELVEARAITIQAGRGVGLSISSIAAALGLQAQSGSRLALRPLDERARQVVRFVAERLAREQR